MALLFGKDSQHSQFFKEGKVFDTTQLPNPGLIFKFLALETVNINTGCTSINIEKDKEYEVAFRDETYFNNLSKYIKLLGRKN